MKVAQQDKRNYLKYIIIIIIILIVFALLAYFIFWNDSIGESLKEGTSTENGGAGAIEMICGDGICLAEEEDTCQEDCAIEGASTTGNEDSEIIEGICGDGICLAEEEDTCQEDCAIE